MASLLQTSTDDGFEVSCLQIRSSLQKSHERRISALLCSTSRSTPAPSSSKGGFGFGQFGVA
ncbi:uncharacterized protein J3R85_002576 [Psidium guajava]|nr:uncharacterized protein J3R85_002576 [Psidium guajava]